MSAFDAPALPGVRRIITGHNEAGIAVVRSEDAVAPEVRRSCCSLVSLVHSCWEHRRAASRVLAATSYGSRPKHLLMTTTASAYIGFVGRTNYRAHAVHQRGRDDEDG